MEVRLRIGVRQSVGEFTEFILQLMPVEQMETTYDFVYGKRCGSKDVFQSTVSTASKQQAMGIEGQFMTEIVRNILSFSILGEEVLIPSRSALRISMSLAPVSSKMRWRSVSKNIDSPCSVSNTGSFVRLSTSTVHFITTFPSYPISNIPNPHRRALQHAVLCSCCYAGSGRSCKCSPGSCIYDKFRRFCKGY